MNEIVLAGCTATPLANYLKALGVLRLLSVQYPETRGCWRGDRFVLMTALGREGIERFFLLEYTPTPIMAPWNGGSGFYDKDNKDALQRIMQSNDARFADYKACLAVADSALDGHDRTASPKDDDKANLLVAIRSQIPDSALGWFDASVLLAGDSPQYPPLLGTGGNDGRLDFTNNFMQRVLDVLPSNDESVAQSSLGWLQTSLFAEPTPGLTKSAIGQFSPGQAGGPNAGTGFDADSSINPWDFVLMIEGALLFAAAAVRRNADDPFGVLSYPFTVRAIGAGSGSLGKDDIDAKRKERKSLPTRGELWMPLWRQPATYQEIRALMAEGRVALGKKPARDALDFVRALHHLGGYRGVQSFQRFGLLMRSGKAFLATPLSRIEVSEQPAPRWLDDLDQHQWLDHFRRFARDDNTTRRFHTLRKRLEDMLFALSGKTPSKAEAQTLLTLLAEIQFSLGVRASAKREKDEKPCPAIPHLSERWTVAADDDTPAFRIAKALAGLRGVGKVPLPIRAQLFPVHPKSGTWMEVAKKSAEVRDDPACKCRLCDGFEGRLADTLPTLLARRLWLAERFGMDDKPLESPAGATLADLAAFLRNDSMDARIADLLPGLALCDIPQDVDRSGGEGAIPAAFALMKLALTPERTLRSLGALADGQRLPVPTGMLAQLAAGNHGNRAVAIAWRRLRASGLAPRFMPDALPTLAGIDPIRAAAALLIPLRFGATGALARAVLKQSEAETV